MRRRQKLRWFHGLDDEFHYLLVPARTSDKHLAALIEQERERVVDAAHCWAAICYVTEFHRCAYGDPPHDFRPDDGPETPIPLIRRVLWTCWRNELAHR